MFLTCLRTVTFTCFTLISTVSRVAHASVASNVIYTPSIATAVYSDTIIISSQGAVLTSVSLQTPAPVSTNLVHTFAVFWTAFLHAVINVDITIDPGEPSEAGAVAEILAAIGDAVWEEVSDQTLDSEAEGYICIAKCSIVLCGRSFQAYR